MPLTSVVFDEDQLRFIRDCVRTMMRLRGIMPKDDVVAATAMVKLDRATVDLMEAAAREDQRCTSTSEP